MFSSKSFIVSGLTFRSLIHFEFIFVYGIRESFNFILLHVAVQFSQHHLLKRLSFLHCIFLPPLSKIRWTYVHGFIRQFLSFFYTNLALWMLNNIFLILTFCFSQHVPSSVYVNRAKMRIHTATSHEATIEFYFFLPVSSSCSLSLSQHFWAGFVLYLVGWPKYDFWIVSSSKAAAAITVVIKGRPQHIQQQTHFPLIIKTNHPGIKLLLCPLGQGCEEFKLVQWNSQLPLG